MFSNLPFLKILKYTFLTIIFLFQAACMKGHCPQKGANQKKEVSKVWVYKYDQSKQCQRTEGISLETMGKEFSENNIRIYESKKEYDGLMRVQVCGAFTGLANLFLIDIENLDKVIAKGFQQWDF